MNKIATSITQSIVISFCLISVNTMAVDGKTDFSSLEAQERAQIISELTFSLQTRQVCTQTLNWDDSGSGADLDGYFFIPTIGKNEYMIGGHASQKRTSKHHCVISVSNSASNPKGSPAILVAPADWKQIWKDSGSGATKDGSFWQAIPPDSNYKCIGSISQLVHDRKPNLPNYRCVHRSLTDKIVASAIVWSDKGTGADKQVTIFNLPSTGVYIAVGVRTGKVEAYDLKKNATSVPDPKMVEELLAKRLAPLKADIEAKTKAIRDKRAAAKEQAEKDAANEAEQKKIAATVEKKKQEKSAAQKASAAKAEAERADSAEEDAQAERLKEQQQSRIAKVMQDSEEKADADKEAMAMSVEEEKVSEEMTFEETPSLFDEDPESDVAAIKSNEDTSASSSEPKEESKGLNSILMFFVKVLGIMVGGILVLIIGFKVLFGKKKTT